MKIKRLQSGGIYFTPFFRESVSPQQQVQSNNNNNTQEDNLIEKEILKIVQQNGLENDTDFFINQVNSFLSKSKNLGGPFLSNNKVPYTMSDLAYISSLANKVTRNKELYDKAEAEITSENAGHEIALSSTGRLYVADDKGIKTVDPDTYFKNQDKYQILTNTELLHYREVIPTLAFKSSILSDLSDTTTMKSIMDYVKSTIAGFGTSKNSEKLDRYTVKQQGLIEEGFEQLLGLAPDGTYKVTSNSEISYNGSGSVEAAIKYLYSTLPNNMKNTLRANVAALGKDPNDISNVTEILEMAIREHTGTSRSTDISFSQVKQDDPSKSGSGSGSGSTSIVSMPFNLLVQNDYGRRMNANTMFGDSSLNFNLPAFGYTPRDLENVFPNVFTLSDANQYYNSQALKDPFGKVYFAGVPIDPVLNGNDIIMSNSKGMAVVYMPVDDFGNINMPILKAMSSIQAQIEQNHITDEKQIQQIWENNGFEYDSKAKVGKLPNTELKRYIVHSGYTSKKGELNKQIFKNNDFISPVDKEIINNLIGIYNNDPNNKDKQKLDFEPGMFGDGYQGLVFIPLNENENEVRTVGGVAYTPKAMSDDIKFQQDIAYRSGAYNMDTGAYNRTLNGTTANNLD